MTCRHEKQLIHQLYGELDTEEAKSLRSHLKSCSACHKTLKELKKYIIDGLKLKSIPYPMAGQWRDISAYRRVERSGKTLIWRTTIATLALAATATAIVITQLSPPTTELPIVVAEQEDTIVLSPLRETANAQATTHSPARRAADKDEGEYPEEGILAKDSLQSGRGVPQPIRHSPKDENRYAPTTEDKQRLPSQPEAIAKNSEQPAYPEPGQGHLNFGGSVAQAPGSGTSPSGGGTSPGVAHSAGVETNTEAAQPAIRIIEPVLTITPTPIPEQKENVLIKHNRINPARDEKMKISVKCDKPEHVSIKIYNQLGGSVKVLIDNNLPPGIHEYTWNGTNDRNQVLASGIYYIVVESPDYQFKEKGVIVK